MKAFIKFEKTFIFIIKFVMFFLLTMSFFILFSYSIPELKTINRTSIISFFTFIVAIYNAIRIYGGFPIGKKHTDDLRNSAILGTLVADFITFVTLYIMSASNNKYLEFSNDFITTYSTSQIVVVPKFSTFLEFYIKTKVFPGFLLLILTFIMQIITIYIFAKFSNIIFYLLIQYQLLHHHPFCFLQVK